MSSPATTFRVFYPDRNTVNALALYSPSGALLTPNSMVDGAGDPAGFKSKVLTFPAASEPLFATPTFADPSAPVSLYLNRDEDGLFTKVLDETAFNAADPRRPTPWGDRQQWWLYDAADQGGGVSTYTVKAPLDAARRFRPCEILTQKTAVTIHHSGRTLCSARGRIAGGRTTPVATHPLKPTGVARHP